MADSSTSIDLIKDQPTQIEKLKKDIYYTIPLYDTSRARDLLLGISLAYKIGGKSSQSHLLDDSETLSNTPLLEAISNVVTIFEDLRVGQTLPGVVHHNNRVGSLINIGVGYDGFIHKAKFKGHSLYKGMQVQVRVEKINYDTKKIELDLLSVVKDEIECIDPSSLCISSKMTCSVCQFDFASREEQVQHYKLDWHRYNLKQKLQGVESVTEDAFDNLAGGISSLSGTDSETENQSGSESTSGSDAVNSPRRKSKFLLPGGTFKLAVGGRRRERSLSVTSTDTECDEDSSTNTSAKSRIHPKLFLRNGKGDVIALYRSAVYSKDKIPENSNTLLSMVQSLLVETKWAIILLGGGHFAAAIMLGGNCVAHKTFHRYTVRAKQGGAQGAKDGKQGGIKSAGASLRRYNETALVKDIQDLMVTWNEELQSCHRIFYRAASFNRQALFGAKMPPFKKDDPRLRTIPFPTRRATFSEVHRIHKILISVECFGPEKLYQHALPQSPRVHLGNKSPLKSTTKQTKNVDNKETTPSTILNPLPLLKLPERLDENANSDQDQSEEDDSAEPVLEIVEEIHTTNHLSEFEVTKKPRKRRGKKKSGLPRHQLDPISSPIEGEEYQFRTALYSACKTGDLEKLLGLLCFAEKPNVINPGESILNPVQSGLNPVESGLHLGESDLNPVHSGLNLGDSVSNKTESGLNPVQAVLNLGDYVLNPVQSGLNRDEPSLNLDESGPNIFNSSLNHVQNEVKRSSTVKYSINGADLSLIQVETNQNQTAISQNIAEISQNEAKSSINQVETSLNGTKSSSIQSETQENINILEENIAVQLNPTNKSPNPNGFVYSLTVLSEPIGDGGGTLLHVAAKEGHKDAVRILMEHGADPTARNKQGYTPYTLAAEKETRNEFRRFWAMNPDKFDYSKSQIPEPLSEEQTERLADRKRERKKQRKDKLKERKAEENEKKVEIEDQQRFLALSDREKRALAAERRFLAEAATKNEILVLSRCFECASDITGKVPFEYNEYRFCNIKCVQIHRKKIKK